MDKLNPNLNTINTVTNTITTTGARHNNNTEISETLDELKSSQND